MEQWTGRPVRPSEVSRTQPWVDIDSVAWGPSTGRTAGDVPFDNCQPQSCPAAVYLGCNTSSQHSRKRAFAEYGFDSENHQNIVPEDLSISLGSLQFSNDPNPDFSRGRPVAVSLQSRAATVPRFLAQPDPTGPTTDMWQGVDDLLSDSRNLRFLNVVDNTLMDPQLHAPTLSQPLLPPQPTPQLRQPQQVMLQHHVKQQQQPFQHLLAHPQGSQQQQQQNRPIQSAASPHSMTLQQQQQHQQQQHRHQQQQQQHHNEQGKPVYQTQQQLSIGAAPPTTAGTDTADIAFWTTPPQHPHSQQFSIQHRVLGTTSASDIPQSTSRCLSGPVARALEVSRFTASCRIRSPSNSQQGLPQLAAPPASGVGSMGLKVSGNIGDGVHVFDSEKMQEVHECGLGTATLSMAAMAAEPYGANVPGWGVPRDLEEHLEMSPTRPLQELQRHLSLRNQPSQAQQFAVQWPPNQIALQQPKQESSWMQQTRVSAPGGGVAVAIGQSMLGRNPCEAASRGETSGGFRHSGAVPYEELASCSTIAVAATAALTKDVLQGSVEIGDERGDFGIAVAPSKLLRRSSPSIADLPVQMTGARTGLGAISGTHSSQGLARFHQDAFVLHHHQEQQHAQQQPQPPQQHMYLGSQQQQQQQLQWKTQQQQQDQNLQQQQKQRQDQQQRQQLQYYPCDVLQGCSSHIQSSGFLLSHQKFPNSHSGQQKQNRQELQLPPTRHQRPQHLPQQDQQQRQHITHLYQQQPLQQHLIAAAAPDGDGLSPAGIAIPHDQYLQSPKFEPPLPLSIVGKPATSAAQSVLPPPPPLDHAHPPPRTVTSTGRLREGLYTGAATCGSSSAVAQLDQAQAGRPSSCTSDGNGSSGGCGSRPAGVIAASDIFLPNSDAAGAVATAAPHEAQILGVDEPQASVNTASGEKDDGESSGMGHNGTSIVVEANLCRAASLPSTSSGCANPLIAAAAPAPQPPPVPMSKAAQRVAAAAAAREAAGATKMGRPRQRTRTSSTLADVIRFNLMVPGTHQFLVGNQDTVEVTVYEDGRMKSAFGEFRSVSSLALAVLRQRNPNRLACDGWQEVKLNGVRLDELRQAAVRLLAEQNATAGATTYGSAASASASAPASTNTKGSDT